MTYMKGRRGGRETQIENTKTEPKTELEGETERIGPHRTGQLSASVPGVEAGFSCTPWARHTPAPTTHMYTTDTHTHTDTDTH